MAEEAAGVMDGPGQAESAKQQIGGGGRLRMLSLAHAHNPPWQRLSAALG